ncbi:2-oxo acid dehydrogenase subunit E2, partial [Acinetobacter nosocomialis]|uniref:2-oxo acid dehydrogenase subunit E2 n=1 Tax=Acinetobacter nosocomialis TaxID=106654 RepID=UPI001C06FA33
GSELLLQPDGKFQWMLAVGALDQYAEGTWWKNGDCIGLKPEALQKLRKQINETVPQVKLSINDMLIKAAAAALIKVPEVNVQ